MREIYDCIVWCLWTASLNIPVPEFHRHHLARADLAKCVRRETSTWRKFS